jgi:hypothetical protein
LVYWMPHLPGWASKSTRSEFFVDRVGLIVPKDTRKADARSVSSPIDVIPDKPSMF